MKQSASRKDILLVVDRNEEACLAAKNRFLCELDEPFDEILTATQPEIAEEILSRHPVTSIISDYDLGGHYPKGTHWILKWRGLFPSIQSAIIITGDDPETVEKVSGIDAILSKSGQGWID